MKVLISQAALLEGFAGSVEPAFGPAIPRVWAVALSGKFDMIFDTSSASEN